MASKKSDSMAWGWLIAIVLGAAGIVWGVVWWMTRSTASSSSGYSSSDSSSSGSASSGYEEDVRGAYEYVFPGEDGKGLFANIKDWWSSR